MASKLGWIKSAPSSSSHNSKRNNTSSSTPAYQPTTSATSAFKDDKARIAEYQTPQDQCPICKSDRYLNPKLRLLVSSSCYHKMCESCIERLFTLGPAPCPTCSVVLRKSGFKIQTFEDLKVEEEVAVRRRIAKHFNKRMEDFVDDTAYNDYLEEVEDITFNLLNHIDLTETEARITAFAVANASTISTNQLLLQEEEAAVREREEEERVEREWRREQGRKGKKDEEKEKEKRRLEVLKELEFSSADPSKIMSSLPVPPSTSSVPTSLHPSRLARKLKQKGPSQPSGPPPPYRDPYDSYSSLYKMLPKYADPVLQPLMYDAKGVFGAGGWRCDEVWERSIRSAVGGLGVGVPRGLDDDSREAMLVD